MITVEEAKKHQVSLQKDGQAILSKYSILKLLSKLGDVHIDGSFTYGLMVKPDIDFHIFTESPDIMNVADVCRELFMIPELTRLHVSNRQSFVEPRPGTPKGIYLGFRIYFQGSEWNFDIWNINPKHKINSETFATGWHEKLTQNQRDVILLLKYNLKELGRYPGIEKGMYASADVYRAVLTGDVHTIEELDNWRVNNPYY